MEAVKSLLIASKPLLLTGGCFVGLYLSRKLSTYLNETRWRPINYPLSIANMYLLYQSHGLLTSFRIPLSSFPLWLLEKYTSMYTLYWLSSVTILVIGVPALGVLSYCFMYLMRRILGVIAHSTQVFLVNGAPMPLTQVIGCLDRFAGALVRNENWSLAFGELVLRTHPGSQAFTEAELNARVPLRNASNAVGGAHTCTVCTEEVTHQQLHRQLPCEHVFHAHCIDGWVLLHKSCPNCRQTIS